MVKLTAVRLREQAEVVVVERTRVAGMSVKTLPVTADLTAYYKAHSLPPALS
ncbi:hypothetical protein E2C01_073131 [Portunus trituberculatus]|uniref:Uncharacterized protein n=1 Tax=Portunus trituberculatus TaxID=210409 RepID=A0A5B7ICJ0_PORTR|nr:hypothetical protein [Portunus trituberculatus]